MIKKERGTLNGSTHRHLQSSVNGQHIAQSGGDEELSAKRPSHEAAYALSPLDGRYKEEAERLREYFSEYAWMRYRWKVEVDYLRALIKRLATLKALDRPSIHKALDELEKGFDIEIFEAIKAKEAEVRHDINAVENTLKDRLEALGGGLSEYKEHVHLGLTSQDVNHTALPMMLRDAQESVLAPQLRALMAQLGVLASAWARVPMLARTHGQPASPTRLGKEIKVFRVRLAEQAKQLAKLPYCAKFGGATGNFNAHYAAYPDTNWAAFADEFIRKLGMRRSQPTTQIEHYDSVAARLHVWVQIMTICIDLCRDVWLYIMMDYFILKVIKTEVGSSAMPHKVNPIDFENAEGNAGMARATLSHLAQVLPISRLQRDLTDSTVSRNIGVALGHVLLALKRTTAGLGKLSVNRDKIRADLQAHTEVIAEGIQAILRRARYPMPYETLKQLTRGKKGDFEARFKCFIDGLKVSEAVKAELRALTPESYLGRS